jgi:hypothetical protein
MFHNIRSTSDLIPCQFPVHSSVALPERCSFSLDYQSSGHVHFLVRGMHGHVNMGTDSKSSQAFRIFHAFHVRPLRGDQSTSYLIARCFKDHPPAVCQKCKLSSQVFPQILPHTNHSNIQIRIMISDRICLCISRRWDLWRPDLDLL